MLQVLWYGLILLVQAAQPDPAWQQGNTMIDVYQDGLPIASLQVRGTFARGSFETRGSTLLLGQGGLGSFSQVPGLERSYAVSPRMMLPARKGEETQAEASIQQAVEETPSSFLLDFRQVMRAIQSVPPMGRVTVPLPTSLLEAMGEEMGESEAQVEPKSGNAEAPSVYLDRRPTHWVLTIPDAGLVLVLYRN